MSRKLAISDIHGCAKTFGALLDNLAFSKADQLFLLGDFIDRGPDSKGVFDRIIQLQNDGYQVRCLRGNHEDMMLDAFSNRKKEAMWKNNGGMDMLESFGVRDQHELPKQYIDLVNSFEYCIETEGFILVHAGLDFLRNDPFHDKYSMMWLRDWYQFIRYDWLGERIIIHGHTPVPKETIEEQLIKLPAQRYLDIDNGCVFAPFAAGRGLGKLCCFDMTNQHLYFQQYVE